MTKPPHGVPPAPRVQRRPLSSMEQIYIGVLRHWYKHRPGTPPRLSELADLCRPKRSPTAVRMALLSAEKKGYVRRNNDGRFEIA